MKRAELEEIIMEEIYKTLAEMRELNPEIMQEKSVPEPYDRKKRRRMDGSQIARRDKIGKAMKADPKIVKRFKAKHGEDWIDYLWATATSKAIRGGKQ
jgi:hypothetical protein